MAGVTVARLAGRVRVRIADDRELADVVGAAPDALGLHQVGEGGGSKVAM